MAQEYIALKENNNDGTIALSTSAFQTISQIVIEEDEDIKLAESSTPFKYPLTCKIVDDKLVLMLNVKIKYGVNVNNACSNLQGKIFENIEHMTGFKPDQIDVRVSGFMF